MYHLPVKDCKRIFDVRNRTYVHYSQPCVLTDSVCEKNPDTSPLKSVNVETLIKKLYFKKNSTKVRFVKIFGINFFKKKHFGTWVTTDLLSTVPYKSYQSKIHPTLITLHLTKLPTS